MPRPRPTLPLLAIPHQHIVEQWLDRFDSSPLEDQVEYSLNLGAESPGVVEDDATPYLPPTQRKFTRRPKPTSRKQEAVDRDCGICFEYAVQPARTLCCGKIFCREHITDWLSGPSSDGRCPSCSAPCSSTNIICLAPSTLSTKPAMSQGLRSVNPSPRHRSQSESTNNSFTSSSGSEQSSTTTTSASSVSPSTLCLSPAPEPEGPHSDQPWFTALMDMYNHRSTSPSLSTLAHSQEEGREGVNPKSSTVEALSRLVSVLGLTVLFYALLASS